MSKNTSVAHADIRRWQAMTGLEARLLDTSQSFAEVAAERGTVEAGHEA